MNIILIFTLMSIIGAIFVSHGKALAANTIWSISNIGFVYYNAIIITEYEMACLFGVYEIIALYGVYNLTLSHRSNTNE